MCAHCIRLVQTEDVVVHVLMPVPVSLNGFCVLFKRSNKTMSSKKKHIYKMACTQSNVPFTALL